MMVLVAVDMGSQMTNNKIVMWWKADGTEVECTLFNKSIEDAKRHAEQMGYKKPVWYKPWQYLFNGLHIIEINFGEKQ